MVSKELLEEFGFTTKDAEGNAVADFEVHEINPGKFAKTGYPKPQKRYEIVYTVPDLNLEEPYFWVYDTLNMNFGRVIKVEDTFSASENSAFFGVTQQRLGIQQDKISQFLATIGKMIKELFQMVRELRILDERLTYYDESAKQLSEGMDKRRKAAEITLKGIFVDLVQGGGKSPGSIYGMARDLEFITLPDLFFEAPPFSNSEELENYVDGLVDFNLAVRRVLKRHLRQYHEWRVRTHKEHRNRKNFQLKYLRQHYQIIQMYITWIKPYLRNAQRLSLKPSLRDSPDLITSFEGSLMDIELLAHDPGKKGCTLITFNYRTRPHMKFVNEGYQRGPVHVGRLRLNIRTYDWDDEQIEQYQKMKEREGIQLMGEVSTVVEQAMKGLGDELERYLLEAEGKEVEEEKKVETVAAPKPKVALTQRLNPVNIWRSMVADFLQQAPSPQKKEGKSYPSNSRKIEAASWAVYKNFKKAHRMVQW